ncbi:outer membrane, MSP2 family domain protein [Anaplasma phagocytophilum str. ApNP]|uniref:Outer membrane, MSP2 family domain protein n=1 Tax=Anaplasma phagocytophilum str. ApNP TaxID=1359153 RepID=A0A0F3NJY5_ANAPH|nr:outer membrane, MSP2 family domain protein [Anaplasma phagocytophilum str. ApNP]
MFDGGNDMKHVVCKNRVGYVQGFTVRCAYKRVLYMVSAILLMLIMGEDAKAVGDRAVQPKKFYAALDYTPAFSKVRDFYISGDENSALVMPYPKIKEEDVRAQGGELTGMHRIQMWSLKVTRLCLGKEVSDIRLKAVG